MTTRERLRVEPRVLIGRRVRRPHQDSKSMECIFTQASSTSSIPSHSIPRVWNNVAKKSVPLMLTAYKSTILSTKAETSIKSHFFFPTLPRLSLFPRLRPRHSSFAIIRPQQGCFPPTGKEFALINRQRQCQRVDRLFSFRSSPDPIFWGGGVEENNLLKSLVW